jgi:protein-tyrosine phosphatase
MIMASMRDWMNGEPSSLDAISEDPAGDEPNGKSSVDKASKKSGRVAVVHCKAGKGRSGTISCSYLISECGWTPEEALARFTERRMRPKFGAGVSIPSQLRWITYVDRWTRTGKKYVDREIEIVEIHVWGLRNGVKVEVAGFVDEGKKIKMHHTYRKDERIVVEGNPPGGNGLADMVYDMAGYTLSPVEKAPAELADETNLESQPGEDGVKGHVPDGTETGSPLKGKAKSLKGKATGLIRKVSNAGSAQTYRGDKTISLETHSAKSSKSQRSSTPPKDQSAEETEPGGMAVILKSEDPIRLPSSDANISVERRNRAPSSMGLTMVTAVAHVWFNTYFEGNGPEQDGVPDASGIFEIEWDAMDGLKGTSRRGTRCFDRIAVVWRAVGSMRAEDGGDAVASDKEGEDVREPTQGSDVPQMKAADWKGDNKEDPEAEKVLGLRVSSPESANVSKASSINGQITDGPEGYDTDSMAGVKISGPMGEEVLDIDGTKTEEAKVTKVKDPGPELVENSDTTDLAIKTT